MEFDGTGISVFELKRDIIIKSGLGDGTDFDLAIYDDANEGEHTINSTPINSLLTLCQNMTMTLRSYLDLRRSSLDDYLL